MHRRERLDDRPGPELTERGLADQDSTDRRRGLEPRREVHDVADHTVLAMPAGRSDETSVHVAARHADAELRPVVVVGRRALGNTLEHECRTRRAKRVVADARVLAEEDHELVSHDLVHFASCALHQRDDAPEVRVEHRGHLVYRMPLGEGRIAGEVGEDDAHLAGAGERLVEVERAVALLVPLRPGDDGDQDERGKHEQVPLPPRVLPVARPCDHDHRLGEESERESESEDEPLLPPTMDAQEAEGGDPEERDPERREEDLPAVQLLGGERVVERGDLEEREGGPDEDARHHDADERRSRPQDTVGPVPFQLDRGTGREGAREQQPDRCRELEARVLPEENSRRRERMQPEEAGAHDARERDEEEAGVAPTARRGRHAPAERGRDRCSAEHDPEVRRMVLPVMVERGPREEEREDGERRNRDRDPVSRAHPVQGSASRVYSHAP